MLIVTARTTGTAVKGNTVVPIGNMGIRMNHGWNVEMKHVRTVKEIQHVVTMANVVEKHIVQNIAVNMTTNVMKGNFVARKQT